MSKKLYAFLFALSLLFAACGDAETEPTLVPPTVAPTATAVPAPTVTPQAVEVPKGCLGWVSGLTLVTYLCPQSLQNVMFIQNGQCGVIHTSKAVVIHFRQQNMDPNGSDFEWASLIKQPNDSICAKGEDALFDIWVEYVSQ